jgi:hypothetical protein
MKKLASLGLVENHRDQGRARWWRIAAKVELPELLQAAKAVPQPSPAAQPVAATPTTSLPAGVLEAVDHGGEIRVIELAGSRDQVGAKKMLELLAKQHGIHLDLPWNFLPESIVLIAKKR